MSTTHSTDSPHGNLAARTTTALRIVVGVSVLAACVMALAEEADHVTPLAAPTELSTEQLERAFWACDHAASTRGVDTVDVIACSQATDALKAEKFGGDFEAMVAWWRVHKDAAHRAFEPAADTVARSEVFPQP